MINGNIYIGSSVNIYGRMTNYLNNTFLKHRKNNNMPIILALLKYGQENFAVLILEYVNIEKLSVRETYYITNLLNSKHLFYFFDHFLSVVYLA